MTPACPFIAKIESPGGEFLGTGFLIAPLHVVTCKHVVQPENKSLLSSCNVSFFCVDGEPSRILGVLEATNDKYDMVLLRLAVSPGQQPVRLLRGLSSSCQYDLSDAQWTVVGHSGRDAPIFTRVVVIQAMAYFTEDRSTGRLLEAQVHQGLENGFSGGPLLLRASPEWFCLGMAYVGGEASGTSRFILADCIVGFLEETTSELNSPIGGRQFFENYDYVRRKPKGIPARISSINETGEIRGMSNTWNWKLTTLATVVLVVALGVCWAAKLKMLWPLSLQPVNPPPVAHSNPDSGKNASMSPIRLYDVRILFYAGSDSPQFSVNGKGATPREHGGGVAMFRLAAGSWHIKADYPERLCESYVTLPGTVSAAADCHLK